MPEWYNQRIQPWVHYVPVKLDYSDLIDSLTFVSLHCVVSHIWTFLTEIRLSLTTVPRRPLRSRR